MYEDDFKKERSERENLNTQKERLTRELGDAKATIAGLQRQLKQVYTATVKHQTCSATKIIPAYMNQGR